MYEKVSYNAYIDLNEYYSLWLYWRNNIYKANGDAIYENIFVYPYFTDIIQDEYTELQRCLTELHDPNLVNQIYYEYRASEMYDSKRGRKIDSYSLESLRWAKEIDLDIGVYLISDPRSKYYKDLPDKYKKPDYPYINSFRFNTPKAIQKARRECLQDFYNHINSFVYYFVYTRKLEVTIMNNYKARLWNNGALKQQLEEACAMIRGRHFL